jgi:hypothetical protein
VEDNVAVTEIDQDELRKILLEWRDEEQRLREEQRRDEADLGN